MKQPTKAIICAAGLGTRFLPQTKAMPKEMLPIIDKPAIQLIVEEAVAAGVTDIIIVTGREKRAIEDHFDRSDTLEAELIENGKEDKAAQIKKISELANFVYIRQKGTPKGNARPVLNASHLIDDDEPFFVFFPDDFYRSEVPRAAQLLEVYNKTGKTVVAFTEVSKEQSHKYGMAIVGDALNENSFRVKGLIEKPKNEETPSLYANTGCYLMTPEVMPIIAREIPGVGGELVLADSLSELAQTGEVYGCNVKGIRHDTGDPFNYVKAITDFAIEHEEFGEDYVAYLKDRLSSR